MVAERRLACRLELGIVRQHDGEVVVGHGLSAAGVAVDDGDGGAPVPLAADEPVAHPVTDGPFAPALLLNVVGDGLIALGVRHAVEPAGVDLRAALLEPRLPERGSVPVRRSDDDADLQPRT